MSAPARGVWPTRKVGFFWCPGELGSLQDMFEAFGFRYAQIILHLNHAEEELVRDYSQPDRNGDAFQVFDVPATESLRTVLQEILNASEGDPLLGALPKHVDATIKALEKKLSAMDQWRPVGGLLSQIRELKADLLYILQNTKLFYVKGEIIRYYGKPAPCGEEVFNNFRDSRYDLEHAGNCIALGEGTAAMFHLSRAMDLATQTLASKLSVTISPRSTWGTVLNGMSGKIEQMPESTAEEKRLKARWHECRVQLWHVKQAWRDDSFHVARIYSDMEAKKVFDTMTDFLQVLVAL